MNQEKKKPIDYGHDKNEWGREDDSEKIEWEEYSASKNKKWKRGNEEELLMTKLEPEKNIDAELQD